MIDFKEKFNKCRNMTTNLTSMESVFLEFLSNKTNEIDTISYHKTKNIRLNKCDGKNYVEYELRRDYGDGYNNFRVELDNMTLKYKKNVKLELIVQDKGIVIDDEFMMLPSAAQNTPLILRFTFDGDSLLCSLIFNAIVFKQEMRTELAQSNVYSSGIRYENGILSHETLV